MDGRGKQSRRGGGIVCNLTKTLGFCWASSLGTSSETQGTTTGRKPLVKFKSTDMREKRQTNFLRTTTVVNSAWGEVLADCYLDSRPVEKSIYWHLLLPILQGGTLLSERTNFFSKEIDYFSQQLYQLLGGGHSHISCRSGVPQRGDHRQTSQDHGAEVPWC